MKNVPLILSAILVLLLLTCNLPNTDNDDSRDDPISIILEDNPETDTSLNYLSCLTPTLDFTEVLTNQALIKLSGEPGSSYPFEIVNNLDWLSFSKLTGTVTTDTETITAYVDFTSFSIQEIKKGTIEILSGSQTISIPVVAQNYFYSDSETVLEVDHNIFTTYNESGEDLSFIISNSSMGGCMVYSFLSEEEWIEFDLPPGYLLGIETVEIPVFINWDLIEYKTLSRGYITVTNHLNPVQTETITIKARSEPELYVSKNKITQKSNSDNSNTFEVGNNLALSLPYTITTDKEWLSVNQYSGSVIKGSNDTIEAYIDYTEFIEGVSKTGTININSDYGNDSITVTATGYPSFKTSTVNIYIKSIDNPTESITITNTGCGVSLYDLSTDSDFLTLSNNHGSLNHGDSVEIGISAEFNNLAWDSYIYSEVKLYINGEEKIFKVNTMREVDPLQDPRLYVNRSSISLAIDYAEAESFTLSNTGTGIMEYEIEVSDSWIILSNDSGSVESGLSDTLSFSIDNYLIESGSNSYIKITTNGVYSNSHIININIE